MPLPTRLLAVAALATTLVPTAADAAGCPLGAFAYAAFGKDQIVVNGNSDINSYDSSVSTATTNSGGNIATNGTAAGAINVSGSSNVFGTASTAAGGSVSTGGSATVAGTGTLAAPVPLPAVVVPTLPAAGSSPSSGPVTPNKSYGNLSCNSNTGLTLRSGRYVMTGLDLNGACDLKVDTSVPDATTGTRIEVYITGTAMHLNGQSVTNGATLKSTDLVFFSNTLTDVEINGGSTSAFALYAPNAQIHLNGGSDIYGAFVGKKFEINGNTKVHYDRALGTMATSAIACTATEISRANPIVASIYNGATTQTCVVQGSFEFNSAAATSVSAPADITSFVFPATLGHMRARLATDVTVASKSFNDATSTPLFDAADGIPTVNVSGCATNGGRFTTACRNVFTNTNAASSTGTTWHPTTTSVDDTSANANIVGPLLTSGLSGFALADWQALIRKVLKGTSNGTVAKLGGVDRSTVAVIGPSTVAGKTGSIGDAGARPSMVYFGGTDGMLHAVCASSGGSSGKGTGGEAEITNYCVLGQELWAFIPRVQLPLLRQNKGRIDGSVRVIDAFGDFTSATATGAKSFRTILTFQTGYADSNAKPAVYAIDVTDPARPIVLWEYTPPSSPASSDLGIGLAMHAGPTIINGAITNLAVAETSNGGTASNLLTSATPTNAGTGVVVRAISLELGTKTWGFEYQYPAPPRGVAGDLNTIPATGVPGGAVGLDLTGGGFTTHVTFGDLYGNLWLLNANKGTSVTGSATTPIFAFSSNRHPIGALPTILDNGATKVAAFGSGGYVDTSTANSLWATGVQNIVGVKVTTAIASAASETSATGTAAASPLLFKSDLTSGENVAGQLVAVGTQLFFLTDNSQFNQSTYGNTGTDTGHSYKLDFTAGTIVVATADSTGAGVNTTRGGASGLANSGTTMFGGVSDKTQRLTSAATTTAGTSVDYANKAKSTRLAWIRTEN